MENEDKKEDKNQINENDKQNEMDKNNNNIEIKIENEDDKNQSPTKRKEEEIVGDNNEEDDIKNIYSETNSSEIVDKEEKQDTSKIVDDIEGKNSSKTMNVISGQESSNIVGDIEGKTNSTNNLFYLGNLFRDVVNKYDKNDVKMTESRKLIRKTISKKNKNEALMTKQEPFNFYDIIKIQLNEVKQKALSYLDNAKKELDKRYSIYIQNINEYINENELKISKVFQTFEADENCMNYADDTIFKQIDYLLEIHENIFSALEEHINLLYNFLDQFELIRQKNPFEYFLNTNSNEILNCWFLSKINFNKLSLSNVIINKDLSDLVSQYLCKKRENNFAKITIQKDTKGNLSLESEFLRDNINNLEKLKFLGLSSDSVNDILKNLNKKPGKIGMFEENIQIGKKLHSLSIIETSFSQNELPKFSLPVLRKAKIKKSFVPLSYFFDSIVGQTSFLKIIDIQNCKLNDKNFIEFFGYLQRNKFLQETIQYLGFSGNELTYINLNRFILKEGELKNLQYFDLSKNNIYEFVTDNFKVLPKIRVLDLSDNNISNYIFFESINMLYKKKQLFCAVLLSNNIFVSNNKTNNREYRKYIFQILSTFKFKIKRVNLSLLYNRDNIDELTTLKISPSVKISLIKLNLSFCGLKTETIWKFFQNNFGLLNLVSLNLSYNFITNNFFVLCAGKDILLEKLKIIDLSTNSIICGDMDNLKEIQTFINNYQKLKVIKMHKNKFINELNELYKKNKENINKIIDELKAKEIKFYIESKYANNINEKIKQIIEFKDKRI